jgi:hypothetical protein
MTEIVIGKEALLHLLKNEGINAVLEEPGEDEVHGNIVAAKTSFCLSASAR